MEAMIGAEAGDHRGKAERPPTELATGDATRIRIDADGDPPRIVEVRLTIFFDIYDESRAVMAPDIRDMQYETFVARWGEPATLRRRGDGIKVFREAGPRVEIVERRGASNRWEIAITAR